MRDLNRVWTEAQVAAVEARAAAGGELDAEDLEQLDILVEVRAAIARATGPVYLVDLHTTSAHGVPFALFGDTLAQRAFVSTLPLPLIMGLEEQVDGVLSSYWTRHGCITFGVEGGQHDDPGSIDNLEAVSAPRGRGRGALRARRRRGDARGACAARGAVAAISRA